MAADTPLNETGVRLAFLRNRTNARHPAALGREAQVREANRCAANVLPVVRGSHHLSPFRASDGHLSLSEAVFA